jgi:hypothetical protein
MTSIELAKEKVLFKRRVKLRSKGSSKVEEIGEY